MANRTQLHVLFVRSGNNGVDPISTNQGLSLFENGLKVTYFDIVGKGVIGYLCNIPALRKYIRESNCDLIHAHYSFSGIIASLTCTKKVVCSLMGSDIYASKIGRWLLKIFCLIFWSATIVKSERSAMDFGLKSVKIIPNGINLTKFRTIEKSEARKRLGWTQGKIILFGADPQRSEKNYDLFDRALQITNNENITVKHLFSVNNSEVPFWMSAADVLVLTSKWEGSPNVIKEALACGCPIVATNVGDISELISGVNGCYVSDLTPSDVAVKLELAMDYAIKNDRTNGREFIAFLDENIIARKLINLYHKVLNV